jgi:phosphohistidine phosphatase
VPALLLLRHGKSDWDAGAADDRSRPLNKRGRAAARTVGRFLDRAGQVPDRVLASPALRAVETLRLAMEAGGWSCPVAEREALYGAGPDDVLGEVRREPATTRLLLVVGHEPTTSETASLLVGGGRLRVPTAALARIDLDVARWSDVGPGTGELVWLVVPRLLDGLGDG